MKKLYLWPLIAILAFAASCARRPYEAGDGWKVDKPENRGLNPDELERMLNRIARSRRIYSFLVVKDGYIVSEYYAGRFNKNSVFRLRSISKSVTSALIGIAIDEGLINCIDTPIKEYFPELCDSKDEITIKHLLSMTTGWSWPEMATHNRTRWIWNWTRSLYWEWFRAKNQVNFILERPQIYAPGYVFNYDTGATHLLAAILQKASGMPADEYAQKRLFDRIGIKSARWARDNQGVTRGGSGLSMTARDAAKFGQLYLDRGNWDGEQIIPEEWVDISTSVQTGITNTLSQHGLHWWINRVIASSEDDMSPLWWDGRIIADDTTYELFYASGFGGQYIFIIPELNMVIVFTSRFLSNNPSVPHLHYIHYLRTHLPRLVTGYYPE